MRESDGETVLVLSQNKPVFYAVPLARYKAMLDLIDAALAGPEQAKARG